MFLAWRIACSAVRAARAGTGYRVLFGVASVLRLESRRPRSKGHRSVCAASAQQLRDMIFCLLHTHYTCAETVNHEERRDVKSPDATMTDDMRTTFTIAPETDDPSQ